MLGYEWVENSVRHGRLAMACEREVWRWWVGGVIGALGRCRVMRGRGKFTRAGACGASVMRWSI